MISKGIENIEIRVFVYFKKPKNKQTNYQPDFLSISCDTFDSATNKKKNKNDSSTIAHSTRRISVLDYRQTEKRVLLSSASKKRFRRTRNVQFLIGNVFRRMTNENGTASVRLLVNETIDERHSMTAVQETIRLRPTMNSPILVLLQPVLLEAHPWPSKSLEKQYHHERLASVFEHC